MHTNSQSNFWWNVKWCVCVFGKTKESILEHKHNPKFHFIEIANIKSEINKFKYEMCIVLCMVHELKTSSFQSQMRSVRFFPEDLLVGWFDCKSHNEKCAVSFSYVLFGIPSFWKFIYVKCSHSNAMAYTGYTQQIHKHINLHITALQIINNNNIFLCAWINAAYRCYHVIRGNGRESKWRDCPKSITPLDCKTPTIPTVCMCLYGCACVCHVHCDCDCVSFYWGYDTRNRFMV